MSKDSKKVSYLQRISLKNKSEEEKQRIIQLFNDNINIAYKVATKYYKTQYWDYEESLQIAQLGLFKACLIWDPDKFKLVTLAYNIINRDFIEFDMRQKRQPDIILSLDEEIKTGDQINVSDLILDDSLTIEDSMVIEDNVAELTQDILYILEDIADELNLSYSVVKLIYLVYIESNQLDTKQPSTLGISSLKFIKKVTINNVIQLLREKLNNLLGGKY